uniref:glycoside hydrolase domain-containing protein n=1 Tax=Candidatus Cryptobacteroides bacterium TaxID=3085639 RepID=UPI004024E54F
MRNILTLAIAVVLPVLMAAQPQSSFRLDWAATGSHCVIGGGPSLEFQKKAFNHVAWRGEKVFAQAVVSSEEELKDVRLSVSDLRNGKSLIGAENIRLQFVSYVVSDLLDTTKYGQCGSREDKSKWGEVLVADVLDINDSMTVPAGRKQPVWMTVSVPSDARPGKYSGKLTVTSSNAKARSLNVELTVADHVLPPARDWTFHLDLWQNPYSVARYENVPLWSDAHFEAMRPVMRMLAEAGQKSVTATIMSRPWNGQTEDAFGSMVTKIRRIDGTWLYDYTIFDRWVEFMFSLGIDRQINCYSMIPWALQFDYIDQATSSPATFQAAPGSEEYNEYWGAFIADFARHLKAKGWFEKTMIAMDERPLESMQAVLGLIRKVEPAFKISLAGNYHEPVIYDIVDFSETFSGKQEFPESAKAKRKELGLTTTFYTCCAEAHPNMFVISNPDEAAWLGWFAQAEGYDGYLRWAYNSWTLDPLTDTRFRTWPAGDCFVVYPGGRGSVRFSKLVEGIQDFEKVRILRAQWQKEGNEAKLAQLTEVLKPFTSDKILEEGPAKALITAKSFLDKQ